MILLFQDQIPVKLGATGTFLLSLIAFALAALNIWQLYKYKAIQRALDALKAAESAIHITRTEMEVYEKRAERLEKENAEANRRVGELSAKTDLSAVLTGLTEMIGLTREAVDLSRKFDRENAQTNLHIANLLERHGNQDKLVFDEIRSSLENLVTATKSLSNEVQKHRKESREMADAVLKAVKK